MNLEEMLQAFDEIQMARPKYVLENLIIRSEDTEGQAYAHCVLEMSIAYDNLRTAKLRMQITELEVKELEAKADEKSKLEAEIKKIEQEQTRRAMLGASREFEALYNIWQSFPKKYTREDLDADQPNYWAKRLTRQANQDVLASGRVSQSNLDALRMIGKGTVPQLDVVRDVEKRMLEVGKSRMLIAVPTEKKAEGGLPCIKDVNLPATSEIKVLNIYERPIADAYDYAVQTAIEDGADWLVTVEDDTFPPPDGLIRIFERARANPGTCVGAWYPKREHPRQGVHIIIGKSGEREFLQDDGEVHEVLTLAMGCSVYPVSMFLKIPRPWFATTTHLSQDSFISQLAREAGYKLLVDTAVKCKHIDRVSGEVFE